MIVYTRSRNFTNLYYKLFQTLSGGNSHSFMIKGEPMHSDIFVISEESNYRIRDIEIQEAITKIFHYTGV